MFPFFTYTRVLELLTVGFESQVFERGSRANLRLQDGCGGANVFGIGHATFK